nr:unnamed protein product [Callosobruchus analis]
MYNYLPRNLKDIDDMKKFKKERDTAVLLYSTEEYFDKSSTHLLAKQQCWGHIGNVDTAELDDFQSTHFNKKTNIIQTQIIAIHNFGQQKQILSLASCFAM